jgi:hypothetical protein
MVDTTSTSVEPIKNDETVTLSSVEATKPAEGDDVEHCPLFMNGLPADFSTNPSLAALASLLDDNSDETSPESKERETPVAQVGGGKVQRKPSRSKRKDGPYKRERSAKDGATIGEASLFLKMWKL